MFELKRVSTVIFPATKFLPTYVVQHLAISNRSSTRATWRRHFRSLNIVFSLTALTLLVSSQLLSDAVIAVAHCGLLQST